MSSQLKKNLRNTNYWFRALYVVLFVFAAEVAATLAVIVAVVQVIFGLVTGHPNQRVTQLGDSLAQYLYQCYLFICFKSDEKPFPFADWPEGESNEPSVVAAKDGVSKTVVKNSDPQAAVSEYQPAVGENQRGATNDQADTTAVDAEIINDDTPTIKTDLSEKNSTHTGEKSPAEDKTEAAVDLGNRGSSTPVINAEGSEAEAASEKKSAAAEELNDSDEASKPKGTSATTRESAQSENR